MQYFLIVQHTQEVEQIRIAECTCVRACMQVMSSHVTSSSRSTFQNLELRSKVQFMESKSKIQVLESRSKFWNQGPGSTSPL